MCSALVLAALPASIATADVEAGSNFSPYRMHSYLMIDGGAGRAGAVAATPCWDIHTAIDAYNVAEPWENPPEGYEEIVFYRLSHEELGENGTFLLNQWLASEGIASYTTNQTRTCTFIHDDGWMAASESIVEVSERDFTLLIITGEGETTCDLGDLLLASATYRYMWTPFSKGWQFYYGTEWIENPAPGVIASANIDFNCATIFDPDTGFSETLEAVPTTQVNLNPSIRGLTGLDTWLWYEFNGAADYQIGPVTASVDALGYNWQIISHAWVDEVLWDIDCVTDCTTRTYATDFDPSGYEYAIDFPDGALGPAPSYEAGAGQDDEAAFEHIYTEIGDYNVSTATTWRGYWYVTDTYDGPGAPHIHPTIVVAQGWNLPVISVRSELRTSPDV